MADTVERLPFAISERLASVIETALSKNGREIHYAIGGIPFRLHVTPDTPMTLETAPQQKNQQDVEPEAGEQTLSGWWLRSQASFHQGTGYTYAESRGEVKETDYFRDSLNVDVWTQGEVRLLRRATLGPGTSKKSVAMIPDSALLAVVVGKNGEVAQYSDLDNSTAATVLYSKAGVNFVDVTTNSSRWYAVGDNGKVYSGLVGSTTLTPQVWSLTGATTSVRLLWAKHRLWAASGQYIYWIDTTVTAGTDAAPTATAALYTHPSTYWKYTDIADVPGGVLFSGYGDGTSHLQRVTVDTNGSAPTMSGATTTAILPSDEIALRICSITGSMVGILTTRGFRVAQTDTSGELVYGPLMIQRGTPLAASSGGALAASGRFWWASWGDEATSWRIDSSVQIDDGVFAYAKDMNYGTSGFVDIALRGERPVVITAGADIIYQHATELEPTGFIQTGRIRYRTDEFKKFQFVNLSADPLKGSIQLDILNDNDTARSLITYNTPGVGTLPTAEVPVELGSLRWMSVKLTLNRDSTTISTGPVIHGVQVKALPAAKPQRIYTLPLDCYDRERWSSGMEDPYGYDGFARDRYMAVRAAEDAGGVVVLRDYRFPSSPVAEMCKIESLKFVQEVQGDPNKQAGGFGGILVVTLRTLT